MNSFLAQFETAIKAVDHASEQSMQWFVIALIFSLAAFAWFVIRYLVKREDARAERDEKQSEARIAAILENTAVLREVRVIMCEVKNLIDITSKR